MEIEYVTVGLDPQVTEYVVEQADIEYSFSPTHVKTEPEQDSCFDENNVQIPSPDLSSQQIKLEPDPGAFDHTHLYLDQNSYHTQEIYVAKEEEPAEVLYQIKGEMEDSDSNASACGWFKAKGKKQVKRRKKKPANKKLKAKSAPVRPKPPSVARKAKSKNAPAKMEPQDPPTEVGLDNIGLLLERSGVHAGFDSYICTECGKSFQGKESVLAHIRSHMKTGLHSCLQCKEQFPDSGSLLRHVQCEHIHNEEYHCSLCGMRFQTVKAFARHMRVHSGDALFVCTVCGKNFRHKSSLWRHQQTHRLEEQDSVSPSGGYASSSSTSSNSSSSSSSSSGSSSSSTSNSSSRTIPSPVPAPKLVIYEQKTPPKTFLCVACGKRFNHSSSLSRHKLTHQEDRKPVIASPPEVIASPLEVIASPPEVKPPPRPSNRGVKAFSCPNCDKQFAHSSSLCRHVQTHSQRPYQCSLCRKGFLTPTALSNHRRCHQGSRSRPEGKVHSCFDCGKTFSHSSSLSRHRHTHSQ